MIDRVNIQNFKSLRNVKVELERFTVFVGPNGSGKTSVLEAIHDAIRAGTSDSQKVFAHERHGDWIYTRGGTGDFYIRCDVAGDSFGIHAPQPALHPPTPERIGKLQWAYQLTGFGSPGPAVLELARRMIFLRMNAAILAKPSYSQDDPPRMTQAGSGLASVLAYMALNDPQGFEGLVSAARSLIPRLRRIRFRKAKVYRTERELVRFGKDTVERSSRRSYQGESIRFDFEDAENISANTASEGTMLMLGLLTVLLGPNRPRLLLLDDLERALHPLAQKQLVEVIRQILEKYPDLQILATAHSPYLLDHLRPEEIRLTTIGKDGYSVCGRLEDHPQFNKWKDEMAPGELWSLFGERWLAEGVPAK